MDGTQGFIQVRGEDSVCSMSQERGLCGATLQVAEQLVCNLTNSGSEQGCTSTWDEGSEHPVQEEWSLRQCQVSEPAATFR